MRNRKNPSRLLLEYCNSTGENVTVNYFFRYEDGSEDPKPLQETFSVRWIAWFLLSKYPTNQNAVNTIVRYWANKPIEMKNDLLNRFFISESNPIVNRILLRNYPDQSCNS